MLVNQKSQYALRAVLELALRKGPTPVAVPEIARQQAIPPRFLEIILGQLKQAGLVASQRGARGGYTLARDPATMTVGEVIQAMQGPIGPVHCLSGSERSDCPLHGNCVFLPMWEEAQTAMSGVFDKTTFADLIRRDHERRDYIPTYSI